MSRVFVPAAARLTGSLVVPPSKSYSHRAIMIGSSFRNTRIERALDCADTRATMGVWRQLGARIESRQTSGDSLDLEITGFPAGRPSPISRTLNCGESGTLIRFLLGVLAQCDGEFIVEAEGSLRRRDLSKTLASMAGLGMELEGTRRGAGEKEIVTAPIRLLATGRIPERIAVAATDTSQLISAFLIAASVGSRDVTVSAVRRPVSAPYVAITADVLRMFGFAIEEKMGMEWTIHPLVDRARPAVFKVPGDWSSAAYPIIAAVLLESDVELTGLSFADAQGDRALLGILERMGARFETNSNSLRICGPYSLRAVEADCGDTPDMVPALAVLASVADGESRFSGIGHLRIKESDRLKTPVENLQRMGIEAEIAPAGDALIVRGNPRLRNKTPVVIDSFGDHRIAMAFAAAGLARSGAVITGAECVAKSYPTFFEHLRALGVRCEETA